MRWLRITGKTRVAERRIKSALLLGLFLFTLALADSSALHKFFHANASQSDHRCAATLLASGQVHSVSGLVTIAPPAPVLVFVAHFKTATYERPAFNLPLSRGPPALFS